MDSIQGALVNWWAPIYGYVNFKANNTSKNIIPVDLILWGEAYHNNHHKFPSGPDTSVRWLEFDSGFFAMKILDQMAIIRLKPANRLAVYSVISLFQIYYYKQHKLSRLDSLCCYTLSFN